jgi:hypothetical protein
LAGVGGQFLGLALGGAASGTIWHGCYSFSTSSGGLAAFGK